MIADVISLMISNVDGNIIFSNNGVRRRHTDRIHAPTIGALHLVGIIELLNVLLGLNKQKV